MPVRLATHKGAGEGCGESREQVPSKAYFSRKKNGKQILFPISPLDLKPVTFSIIFIANESIISQTDIFLFYNFTRFNF